MGKSTRGRPRKAQKDSFSKDVNTSNQTAGPTTEENPQPLADPDTSNLDATNAGTAPTLQISVTQTKSKNTQSPSMPVRRSPRLKKITEGKFEQEDELPTEQAVDVNTSHQTVGPTPEENPQPLADPDTNNLDATNAGISPTLQDSGTQTKIKNIQDTSMSVRSSPRLKTIREGKSKSEQEDELPTEQAVDATGASTKKRKAAEVGMSSDLALIKGKASKRKKVGPSRSSQLKIGQAADEQNLDTSSGNADPSADFKSLYMDEKRRADELEGENRKLKDQLHVALEKLNKQEKVILAKDTLDDTATAKDTPDDTATEKDIPDDTATEIDDTENDTPDATDIKQDTPDTNG